MKALCAKAPHSAKAITICNQKMPTITPVKTKPPHTIHKAQRCQPILAQKHEGTQQRF